MRPSTNDALSEWGNVEPRDVILVQIADERNSQDDSSDASHDPHVWIAKIAKHLGRAVSTDPVVFRRAMVVIAALAVAAIEWTDERFGTGA